MFLEIGLLIAYDQYEGRPRRRRGHRTGRSRRTAGRHCRERRDGEGGRVVAGDDHEDSARAGDRDAQSRADRVSGGFGRRESAVSGRHLSRPVRRGANLLLQLAHAAEAAGAADLSRDGAVYRGRRVSAGAERRHHHGRGHQFHGARRTEPGEGRHRSGDRHRNTRRREACTRNQRRGALHGEGRCRLPGASYGRLSRSAAAPRVRTARPRRSPPRL